MAPQDKNGSLKRARQSPGAQPEEQKKARRSARLSVGDNDNGQEGVKQGPLPSPITRHATDPSEDDRTEPAWTPPVRPISHQPATPPAESRRHNGLSSPPNDTQPYSQFLAPSNVAYEVDDEEGEGVWGYLVPVHGFSEPLVLRKRAACPVPLHATSKPSGKQRVAKDKWKTEEEKYEVDKAQNGTPAGGYLLGRHPECDRIINVPTVSNRHCLFFSENKSGDAIAVLEDLSGNGTYVNDAYVGRNKRRELQDGDEISILDEARFIFRYPRRRDLHANAFRKQYSIQGQLGKGHFATVYLALEKCSGTRFAVKKFEKRSGPGERSKVEGLQQEIAVLMGVSHPNLLCLKDTFDERDGVYLVLELAPEGELFNWIVMKQKLSEAETRKVFIQLFQGVKYLHERNIVHRDIKPENILLLDKELNIKIADFGLAKIIGEESFTTTLCGTPSYVAPEILEQTNRRRYTRAVDVWSLGVVLYICLCGFPPFSDELYSPENPYTLSQQIKMGRFDYPSPYWDSVGDPALDLIDRMLTVDVEKRISIDECLEHPWLTQRPISVTDSTDGLTGAFSGLDFSKRKVQRERTMLSSINDVKVDHVIESQPDLPPVKVWDKNGGQHHTQRPASQQQAARLATGKKNVGHTEHTVEAAPDAARDPEEFMEMGGRGDQVLFGEGNGNSIYPSETVRAGAVEEEEK
ncbi:putative serine/threonine-protein kinase fhkC [Fulvia fulva]|uniref:Serine/threonine-protein kinase fhkC n=1 Tax=Passalora fulva TaxID=5499 RepID=A0A9Q8LFV1_PASFU|nr:putative serine/threonine-protein kinase fhkC [Fulvia fulva]KAK4615377.1 putative serine/threonine-protein kinase fhkC [Fulvia fulva]KAK4616656.1 putative serine/threonine-protein kinase fhkC [Fulvia fulva]UJO16661.1 putative serine/threonine-protein kinase fhkC [Fulvia fulva]WPV19110.1 putative serine/threonine-protein kinase fhkC [Fulvia fulva]WPV34336.1 putative serine/threonine-protein kinase fhkC [Fulvia fulva]